MKRTCMRCGASGPAGNGEACERCEQAAWRMGGETSGVIDVRALTAMLGPGEREAPGRGPAAARLDGLATAGPRLAAGGGRATAARSSQAPVYAVLGALVVGMVGLAGYTLTRPGPVAARGPGPLLATYVASAAPEREVEVGADAGGDAPREVEVAVAGGREVAVADGREVAAGPAAASVSGARKPVKRPTRAPEAGAGERPKKAGAGERPERAAAAVSEKAATEEPASAEPSVQCLLDPAACRPRRTGAAESAVSEPAVVASDLPEKLESTDIREGTRAARAAAVAGCRALARGGEAVKVKLSIAGPSGSVLGAEAEDDAGNPALGSCCAKELMAASFKKFAKAQMGALVTVKF